MVDKILGYYFALNDIANLEDEDSTNPTSSYDKYVKLLDLVNFDPDKKIIKIKLANANIEINCKRLDWKNIISKFDEIIEQKVKLNPDEKLKIEFEKLKRKVAPKRFVTMDKYYKYAQSNELELEPKIKFQKYWINYCDFLNIDTSNYPKTKEKFKKTLIKYDVHNVDDYNKLIETYDLPHDPCEFYKVNKFTNFFDDVEELFE